MFARHPPLKIIIAKKTNYFALLIRVVVIKPLYFKDATTGTIQR